MPDSSGVLRFGLNRATTFTKDVSAGGTIYLAGDEARHGTLILTGSLPNNTTVVLPVSAADVGLDWVVTHSATENGHTLKIAAPNQTGFRLTSGTSERVGYNGTDIIGGGTDAPSLNDLSGYVRTIPADDQVGITIIQAVGQAANPLEIKNSGLSLTFFVDPSGSLSCAGFVSSLPIQVPTAQPGTNFGGTGDLTAMVSIGCGTDSTPGLAISAHSPTQNGDLTTWQTDLGVILLKVAAAGHLTFRDGVNLIAGTSTGTKIGATGGAAGEKWGFFGATPVVQQLMATGTGKTVDQVITALQTLGLFRQS